MRPAGHKNLPPRAPAGKPGPAAPRGQGSLRISVGYASSKGRRPDNQDFGAVDLGTAQERNLQGIVAVIADGVGGNNGGGVAAELAVRSFLDGYRSQSVLVGIAAAALKALDAYNRWLHAQAHTTPALRGAATTFTAGILRGRVATILHVGDSRAWHFRAGNLGLLTNDHVSTTGDGNDILLRAVGLEPALRLDVSAQRLEAHDRLLLTTDGVHGTLTEKAITQFLGRRASAQADAETIVAGALAAGGRDNATALLIDILEIPAPDFSAIAADLNELPFCPAPVSGDVIDGFRLVQPIAESQTMRIFLAKDGARDVALKFPRSEGTTREDRSRFQREVFVGRRMSHPAFGGALELPDGRQTRLYLPMPFHRGETLEQRIRRAPLRVEEALSIGMKVGRALVALHRAGIIHRDVNPRNIMVLDDGEIKLIDFGVSYFPHLEAIEEAETPGTADFMAPELFDYSRGDPLSEQYAFGVTLYRMLTARYPFGETPPGSRPMTGPIPNITHYRSDVPAWLDAVILRAMAPKREDRFGDIDELLFELEHGTTRAAPLSRTRPLLERNPLLFWQLLCALFAIGLIFCLVSK